MMDKNNGQVHQIGYRSCGYRFLRKLSECEASAAKRRFRQVVQLPR
jgi:hypothetical protein